METASGSSATDAWDWGTGSVGTVVKAGSAEDTAVVGIAVAERSAAGSAAEDIAKAGSARTALAHFEVGVTEIVASHMEHSAASNSPSQHRASPSRLVLGWEAVVQGPTGCCCPAGLAFAPSSEESGQGQTTADTECSLSTLHA